MEKPLRVLMIEDSESDAALILHQLESEDYTVAAKRVENADDLSLELHMSRWDIIIADYQLPGFDAPAALSLLQETGLDIPFIVVSGAIGEETAVELMRNGACDFLMKRNLVRLASVVERELTEVQIRQERSLALKALLESENNLRKSQKVAKIGHWVWHRTIDMFDCSDEMLNIFGVHHRDCSKDLFGPESKMIHPDDLEEMAEIFNEFKSCLTQKSNEFRVVRPDGSVRYVSSLVGDCIMDENGDIVSISGVVQDITERKKSEKDLRQWADAFQNCSHGIAMIGADANDIMICNPAFANIIRLPVGGIIDRPLLEIFLPEEHDYVGHCISEADRAGQVRFESYVLHNDKSVFPVQMDLVSVRNNDGILLYRVATMQDITRQKQAESALYQEIEKSKMRARELEAITDVSSSMRRAQTKSDLVAIIVNKLREMLEAQYAVLAFIEGDYDSCSEEDRLLLKPITAGDGGVFDEVIRDGKPVITESMDDGLLSRLPEWIQEDGQLIASMLIYPLQIEMTTIGLIFLAFEQEIHFKQEQINLVAAVAEMAGSALNRMHAVEDLEKMVGRREEELESIYQVTSAASKTLDIRQALQQALELTLEAVHTNAGGIYLSDELETPPELLVSTDHKQVLARLVKPDMLNGFLERVIENKKAIVIPFLFAEEDEEISGCCEGRLSLIGLPMHIQDRIVGILVIIKECGQQVNVDEMTLLSFIADHVALVVENTRLYQKAERSAVLNERSRMARELHDSVTQSLYSANLYSVGAQRFAARGNYQEVDDYLEEIGRLTHQSLCDMRLMVYELRSPELIQSGLVGALQNRLDSVERRSKIIASLETDIDIALPEKAEENLYWIAIEALNNSLKHASASHISIRIYNEENTLVMSITDNGIGFNPVSARCNGGVGLKSMHERAEALGGSLSVHSTAGEGTRVEVFISGMENKNTKIGGRI